MVSGPDFTDAMELARRIRGGDLRAAEVVTRTLATIRRMDPDLNCFNAVFAEQALADATRVDAAIAAGQPIGPMAGVPFGVKALFDVGGTVTTSGATARADCPPADRDATVIQRLRAAGALLIGTLNMDEFAFGFTTENAHFGATRNPHDQRRVAGGSSGGSAASVAAGLLPLTLGSDTNGSVRVPASLCGVFGLKPTLGIVPRTGVAPLTWSFDHVGWFARSVRDLAAVMDLLAGADPADPLSAQSPPADTQNILDKGIDGLRIGIGAGHFGELMAPDAREALAQVTGALGASNQVHIPDAGRAVAASLLITAAEGASLHEIDIRTRLPLLDGKMRDRWIAASLIPAAWIHDAQRFRRTFADGLAEAMKDVDILITPTTPYGAIELGQATIEIDGKTLPAKPTLGRYTAPFSFIGWPALSVPVRGDGLPLGVQLVAKPRREDHLLRAARHLEAAGILVASGLAADGRAGGACDAC